MDILPVDNPVNFCRSYLELGVVLRDSRDFSLVALSQIDAFVARGVDRRQFDPITGLLMDNLTSGKEMSPAYRKSLTDAHAEFIKCPLAQALGEKPSEAALTALRARYCRELPAAVIDDWASSLVSAYFLPKALSVSDRVKLRALVSSFNGQLARLVPTGTYVHDVKQLVRKVFQHMPLVHDLVAWAISVPGANIAPVDLKDQIPQGEEGSAVMEGLRRHAHRDQALPVVVRWANFLRAATVESPRRIKEAIAWLFPDDQKDLIDQIPPMYDESIEVGALSWTILTQAGYPDWAVRDCSQAAIMWHLDKHVREPQPFDHPLREWLWNCYRAGSATNFTVPEKFAWFVGRMREYANTYGAPTGWIAALATVVSTIGLGLFDVFDKMLDICCVVIGSISEPLIDWLEEYLFLGRATLSGLLPEHRRRRKSVWVILFGNDYSRLSPAEKFLLSCKDMEEPRRAQTYHEWAQQRIIDFNQVLGTDLVEYNDPVRPVRLPRNPLVVDDDRALLDQIPLMPTGVRTEELVGNWVKDKLLAAGVPRGFDGTWFGTPERIAQSIRRYDVERPPADSMVTARVKQAAHALANRWPEMYKSAVYLTPQAAMRKIKVKFSPGLPLFPQFRDRKELAKVGLLDAAATVAEKYLSEGTHPGSAAHAFPKMDVVNLEKLLAGKNIRTVIAQELVGNIMMWTSTLEATRRQPPLESWVMNAVPRSEGGFRPFFEAIEKRAHVFASDGHQFDSQIAPVITVDGLAELRSLGFENTMLHDRVAPQIRANYIAMRDAFLVDSTSGRVFDKTGGMMTGQANTSVDNRDAFRLIIIAAWSLVTERPPEEFFDKNDMGNAGDDNLIGTDESPQLWDEIMAKITEVFGVTMTREGQDFDKVDLVGLGVLEVPSSSVIHYTNLGIPIPRWCLASQPDRLLMKKTEFRWRDAMAYDVQFYMKHVNTLIGSAFLAAHLPEVFTNLGEEYIKEMSYVLNRFYKTHTVVERRSRTGDLVGISITAGDRRQRYVGKDLSSVDKWLKSTQWPEYAKVMSSWLKAPVPEQSNMAKSHSRILGWNPPIRGVDRATFGVIQIREALWSWIPNHVVKALPEFTGEDVTYILRNADYCLAKFVWLSLYHTKKAVPTASAFRTALKESPYTAAEDPDGFLRWLATGRNMQDLIMEDLEKHRARMIIACVVYCCIEVLFKSMSQVPGLGLLAQLFLLATRDVNRLYSLANHIHFLAEGRSSVVISNMIPADPYAWMKQFAIIIASAVPAVMLPGRSLVYITKLVPWMTEIWVAANLISAPNVIRPLHRIAETPTRWAEIVDDLRQLMQSGKPFTALVTAPTGTGKSTAFIGGLLNEGRVAGTIWILCPTVVARDGYQNVFIPDGMFQIVSAGVALELERRVKVLTYHHMIAARLSAVAAGDIVIFDEVHEGFPIMLATWHSLPWSSRIQITATPNERYQPACDLRLNYGTKRRFEVEQMSVTGSLASLLQVINSETPALLSRALVVVPTKAMVAQAILTFGRLSIPAFELSGDFPVASKIGVVVATTIVDTAVTIEPPPSCLIDMGLMLQVTWDFTGMFPVSSAKPVPTNLRTHTQRLGRVGRAGNSKAFQLGQGGSGSEPELSVTAYDVLNYDTITVTMASTYGVVVPVKRINPQLSGMFGFMRVADAFEFAAVSSNTKALAVALFVRLSNAMTVESAKHEFLNLQIMKSEYEMVNQSYSDAYVLTFGNPLLGDFDAAEALLLSGFIQVQLGLTFVPATCLVIRQRMIVPCGLNPTASLIDDNTPFGEVSPRQLSQGATFEEFEASLQPPFLPVHYGETTIWTEEFQPAPQVETIRGVPAWLPALFHEVRAAMNVRNLEPIRGVTIAVDDDLPTIRYPRVLAFLTHFRRRTSARLSIDLVGRAMGSSASPLVLAFVVAASLPAGSRVMFGPLPQEVAELKLDVCPPFMLAFDHRWAVVEASFARGQCVAFCAAINESKVPSFLMGVPKTIIHIGYKRPYPWPNAIHFGIDAKRLSPFLV